jgi:transcriptional regulator of acetoin/glycerol metabolism
MNLSLIERHRKAREQFFSGEHAATFGVDAAILRGWQRSLALGVEPDRPVVFQAVHLNEARAAIDASHAMLSAARVELDHLAKALVPRGATVILANQSMITIGVRGREEATAQELRIASREGVDLSERAIGSNALTISSAESAPSIVLNNAHFCTMNSVFACAAAPIRNANGAVLGVLDVTTCHRALPAEAPFLVNAAAKSIENALFVARDDRMVIRFHPRQDFVGTPLEGVIACTMDGEIAGANEAALGLLDLRWPLRGEVFDRCFRYRFLDMVADAGRLEQFSLALSTASGIPLFASVTMPAQRIVVMPVAARGLAGSAGGLSQTERRPRAGLAESLPAPVVAGAAKRDRGIDRIVGADGGLRHQLEIAARALEMSIPVLIQGESGTGKGPVAAHLGWAAGGPEPLRITCASVSDAVFAQEIERVLEGTLILDEVADLSDALQLRLLRLLKESEATAWRGPAGPRLICTTIRDLRQACADGQFRMDLYTRIKGALVVLPALRGRVDRDAVVERTIRDEFVERFGIAAPGGLLARGARDRLCAYAWPGNLRELEWVARTVVATLRSNATIEAADLPGEIFAPAAMPSPRPSAAPEAVRDVGRESADDDASMAGLRALQDKAIERAIAKHQGNLSSAARELGVSRGTLYRRLKARGADLPRATPIR